jgi:hypothetical protein
MPGLAEIGLASGFPVAGKKPGKFSNVPRQSRPKPPGQRKYPVDYTEKIF